MSVPREVVETTVDPQAFAWLAPRDAAGVAPAHASG